MNYDKKYTIRLAKIGDVNGIMRFINEYWRKGHILAVNRDMFYYEHVNKDNVNFLLAINKETGEIDGLLGYILASRNFDKLDIWTGIWKVKKGVLPLLGMELYKRLQPMVGSRSLLGVGDSQISTGPLLRKLTSNFKTWRMNHYYFLNQNIPLQLADIVWFPIQKPRNINVNTTVEELKTIQEVEQFIDITQIIGFPYKDYWYLNHRFFQHPIYKYNVFGLTLSEKKALLVCRMQECNGSSVLRIVDYIGSQECFSGIYSFISKYLCEFNCEYVDFYEYGFDSRFILDAGFTERKQDDKNIIPNYFYPLERRNIEIWVSGNIDEGLFTKADGDQDRPN